MYTLLLLTCSEEIKDLVMNVPEGARLVHVATNNEQWGPHGQLMKQISDLTFSHQDYNDIMDTLFRRLGEKAQGANWRNVYKVSWQLLSHATKGPFAVRLPLEKWFRESCQRHKAKLLLTKRLNAI